MKGAELCLWGDAGIADSGDILIQLSPFLGAVGETWWSPSSVSSNQGLNYFPSRLAAQRCRTIARGIPSKPLDGGDVYAWICPMEYFFSNAVPQ